MLTQLIQSNPLFLIIVVPIIVDIICTVTGQDKEYWTSNYKIYKEAAPVYLLLRIHPLLFIVGTSLIWLPFTFIITYILPQPLNLWATLALFAAHSYNSVSWFRATLKNLGIFAGKDRISTTLSLFPMAIYELLIGYIAAIGVIAYFS